MSESRKVKRTGHHDWQLVPNITDMSLVKFVEDITVSGQVPVDQRVVAVRVNPPPPPGTVRQFDLNRESGPSLGIKMAEDASATARIHYQQLEEAAKHGDSFSIGNALAEIGLMYGSVGEYERALDLFSSALDQFRSSGNPLMEVRVLAKMADAECAQQHLETALEHALKVITIYDMLGDQPALAGAYVSVGTIYEKMGRLDVALGYQRKAYSAFEKNGILNDNAQVLLNLGNLYRKCGQLAESAYILEQGLLIAQERAETALEHQANELISDTFEQLGEHKRALYHARRAALNLVELKTLEKQRALAELQLKFDVETAQKEKELLNLKNEQLSAEIKHKTKELSAKTLNLVERNEFLKSIRSDLLTIESKCLDELLKQAVRALRLKLKQTSEPTVGSMVLEAEFEEIHGEFMRKLAAGFPDLTHAELKVCALQKLGLTTKEIANILHLTNRNVEQHRYRIRKKLHMVPHTNVTTFLNSLLP